MFRNVMFSRYSFAGECIGLAALTSRHARRAGSADPCASLVRPWHSSISRSQALSRYSTLTHAKHMRPSFATFRLPRYELTLLKTLSPLKDLLGIFSYCKSAFEQGMPFKFMRQCISDCRSLQAVLLRILLCQHCFHSQSFIQMASVWRPLLLLRNVSNIRLSLYKEPSCTCAHIYWRRKPRQHQNLDLGLYKQFQVLKH